MSVFPIQITGSESGIVALGRRGADTFGGRSSRTLALGWRELVIFRRYDSLFELRLSVSVFVTNNGEPHSLGVGEINYSKQNEAIAANLRFVYRGGREALSKLGLQKNVVSVLGDAEPVVPVQSVLKINTINNFFFAETGVPESLEILHYQLAK